MEMSPWELKPKFAVHQEKGPICTDSLDAIICIYEPDPSEPPCDVRAAAIVFTFIATRGYPGVSILPPARTNKSSSHLQGVLIFFGYHIFLGCFSPDIVGEGQV